MVDDRAIIWAVALTATTLIILTFISDGQSELSLGLANQPKQQALSLPAPALSDRLKAEPLSTAPIRQDGGVYHVAVILNRGGPYQFTIDSGASDISVPQEVVEELLASGRLGQGDFSGKGRYRLADGSVVDAEIFTIREVTVGNVTLENVRASIAPAGSPALLGQSFLGRLTRWHVDNQSGRLELVL